jgi:DNA polymerase-1
LVSAHTLVQLPQRGDDDKVYGIEDFSEKYPLLKPHQLPDLKGLMGDSSDNIPGVAGIGEKGALKLLQGYKNLENLYANIHEQKGALKEKLELGREMAFLSRELATIKRDVPIDFILEACLAHDFDPTVVEKLFRELDFRSLTRQLHKLTATMERKPSTIAVKEPSTVEAEPIAPIESVIVNTSELLQVLVEKLNQATWISFDVETTSTNQMEALLVGIGLAVDDKTGYYVPIGHIDPNAPPDVLEGVLPNGIPSTQKPPTLQRGLFTEVVVDIPQLSLETVIKAIRPALTNPHIPKIGHNAKYDVIMLRRYGIDVHPIHYDPMIAEWLCDATSNNLGLKNLALIRLGLHMTQFEDLVGTGKKQITFARVPLEKAAPYCAADVVVPMRLMPLLSKELADHQVTTLFETLELPLIPIIADMEMHGVLLDLPFLKELETEFKGRLNQIAHEIYQTAGYGEFNINSLNQLSDVLFGKLKLNTRGLKKTKTGNYSMTADVLEDMVDAHPIISMILNYRTLNKLLNTYVEAIPALVNPYTGRVHTSYNQTGASTGRFSSSDPNLQNIPIRTEEGRRIRKAFIAPGGHKLLSVDYSQVELRILAHYSGDETLLDAFHHHRDIHASTAAAVYGIPLEQVTFEQRSFAKSVNFGLMYGMGAFRLSHGSGLTMEQAKDFINTYFARFPGVKKYLDQSKRQAADLGYVETLFGRRRYFPSLQNLGLPAVTRQRAEREAINAPIQGTAADILKKAMIDLHHALKLGNYRAEMVLQVHDELVLEVPEDEINAVAPLVIHTMESAYQLQAPLKAEARIGENWTDMTPFHRG